MACRSDMKLVPIASPVPCSLSFTSKPTNIAESANISLARQARCFASALEAQPNIQYQSCRKEPVNTWDKRSRGRSAGQAGNRMLLSQLKR